MGTQTSGLGAAAVLAALLVELGACGGGWPEPAEERRYVVTITDGTEIGASGRPIGGRVHTDDGLLDCGASWDSARCSLRVLPGSTLVLRAAPVGYDTRFTPPRGNTFLGWGGDCAAASESACTLKVDGDRHVVATFAGTRRSHPDLAGAAAHGPAYAAFVANAPGALSCTDCHGAALQGGAALSCATCHPWPRDRVDMLVSAYLSGSAAARSVIGGEPYDMREPGFQTEKQHRSFFAYQILSALHMLGYETRDEIWPFEEQQIRALMRFQRVNGYFTSPWLTRPVLLELDRQLALREPAFVERGARFPLQAHLQPLLESMPTRSFVGMMYGYPLEVLPTALHLADHAELVQCIHGQCLGFIQDATGADWPTFPVDLAQDYRVVGAYYDPFREDYTLPSAATLVQSLLHEYAHYLDGAWECEPARAYEHRWCNLDTMGFYAQIYELEGLDTKLPRCVTPRSASREDFTSAYAFASARAYPNGCPAGQWAPSGEDFAEAFAAYVVAGRRLRAAASANETMARKYAFLRDHVFGGVEYDTDASLGLVAPDCQEREPWLGCHEDQVWDGELRTLSLGRELCGGGQTLPHSTCLAPQ